MSNARLINGSNSVQQNWDIAMRDDGRVTRDELDAIIRAARDSNGMVSWREFQDASRISRDVRRLNMFELRELARLRRAARVDEDLTYSREPAVRRQARENLAQYGDYLQELDNTANNAAMAGQLVDALFESRTHDTQNRYFRQALVDIGSDIGRLFD